MVRKLGVVTAAFVLLALVNMVAVPAGLIASAHGASPSPSLRARASRSGAAAAAGAAFPYDRGWLTYASNGARSGDTVWSSVDASNAASLSLRWTQHVAGSISAQPVVASRLGLVFWGSWDGYERATNLTTQSVVWSTFLGQTSDSTCSSPPVGVASTATVDAIGSTPVVFVGGGDAHFYALNATTGQIIWSTALDTPPSYFIWSSPAVYNGSIYIGIASFGDCPLVQGQLIQLNASTGAIQHTFQVVSSACRGGTVWGSPTIDAAAGYVYFATGNPGACSSPYTEAVIKVSAADASSAVDSWQLRGSENADLDFGSTPTLFTAIINGTSYQMLGIGNKDGMYYALDRNNLHGGTLWRANIANSGSCPDCGTGTISPSAWDGTTLYVAGGSTTVNGVSCAGSLSALSPSTGAFLWRHCLQGGPVLGAVSVSGSLSVLSFFGRRDNYLPSSPPSVAFVGQGTSFMGIRTSDGVTLFSYHDTGSGSKFWGSAAIAGGVVYMGNMDGTLYAFGT